MSIPNYIFHTYRFLLLLKSLIFCTNLNLYLTNYTTNDNVVFSYFSPYYTKIEGKRIFENISHTLRKKSEGQKIYSIFTVHSLVK